MGRAGLSHTDFLRDTFVTSQCGHPGISHSAMLLQSSGGLWCVPPHKVGTVTGALFPCSHGVWHEMCAY